MIFTGSGNGVPQPTKRPTNKLTAAVLGAFLVSVSSVLVRVLLPEWYDPEVFITLGPVATGLLGYVIMDAPNT